MTATTPPLEPELRDHLIATVATCRADWSSFDAAVLALRDRGASRQRFEELLLQGTLFFGFPRTVSAFEQLRTHWPRPSGEPNSETVSTAPTKEDARRRGEALFAEIYAHRTDSVREMLADFHPEFHDFVLESAYGRILARPGLSPMWRELCAVAALSALDQVPQLIAHARGALRLGASVDQVRAALRIAGCEDEPLVQRIQRGLPKPVD